MMPSITRRGMEALTSWLTPVLVVALFTLLWRHIAAAERCTEKRFEALNRRLDDNARETAKRFDAVNRRLDDDARETAKRFDAVHGRFDAVLREIADLRERMAKLEGALEGFLAGRRDRDAA